jgi:hypothetical protein
MGPSYQSRRQEASAQLLELVKMNPAISQVAGDLLVESMDIPNGKAIAERLRKMLPPEIRPPDDKQPPPQVLAQQLQQSQQMTSSWWRPSTRRTTCSTPRPWQRDEGED